MKILFSNLKHEETGFGNFADVSLTKLAQRNVIVAKKKFQVLDAKSLFKSPVSYDGSLMTHQIFLEAMSILNFAIKVG